MGGDEELLCFSICCSTLANSTAEEALEEDS